ncbi:MAG: SH3 domain-containing protein [Rickettsiales bacterium]
MQTRLFLLFLSVIFASHPVLANKNGSGLPIPRFVSLKDNETNVRTGPGTRYPIQWIYHRENMPVEIIEEFDMWRKVRDVEGSTGWIHKIMLKGARYVIIQAKEPRVVRIDSDPQSKPLLKVSPNVIAHVLECELRWCRIQVSGRKGWIERRYLWGIHEEEVFD